MKFAARLDQPELRREAVGSGFQWGQPPELMEPSDA
jgi:hypothetical protein